MTPKGAAMQSLSPPSKTPIYWKVAGTVFRSAFLIAVAIVTARISLPDSLDRGTLAHFALADFARAAIGIAICIFMFVQLFRRPQDEGGYKAWAYIGLAIVAVAIFVLAVKGGFPNLT